jgi:hypothetical protein
MKQLLFLQTILVFFSQLAFSQDFCENQYSVPSELFRGRYEEPDMRLGHPYTMFNKNSPNWSLEFALENIRVKIKNGINPFKQISQFEDGEYARIYIIMQQLMSQLNVQKIINVVTLHGLKTMH